MFTPSERARIQAKSHCAAETVKAYPNCREASRLRIEAAAREEGIVLPGASSSSTAHLDGPDQREP